MAKKKAKEKIIVESMPDYEKPKEMMSEEEVDKILREVSEYESESIAELMGMAWDDEE